VGVGRANWVRSERNLDRHGSPNGDYHFQRNPPDPVPPLTGFVILAWRKEKGGNEKGVVKEKGSGCYMNT